METYKIEISIDNLDFATYTGLMSTLNHLIENSKHEIKVCEGKNSETSEANLNIGVVSNRREQLLSFLEWYRNEQPITCNHKFIIDKYLNLSNCC